MKKFLAENYQKIENCVLLAMWIAIIIVDIVTGANPYVIGVAAVMAICFGVLVVMDFTKKVEAPVEKKPASKPKAKAAKKTEETK